jgi:4-alpha-glucanotransferase
VVRRLKQQALSAAFDRFREHEWTRDTLRAHAFKEFVDREALVAARLRVVSRAFTNANRAARGWSGRAAAPPRGRALDDVRRELADEICFRQYLQWIADEQWRHARDAARAHGVELFGDLPFMVDGDSADVWARQSDFRLDASVGVPPDAFSATGQDWGMPAYRWDAISSRDFRWLRDRARRSARSYDGYRIDHLVGFYRTYSRPRNGGSPSFEPANEPEQLQLGERLMSVFREPGAEFLRRISVSFQTSSEPRCAATQIAGFRVFRWEREWTCRRTAVSRSPRYPTALGRHLRHARHRTDGHLVGRSAAERTELVARIAAVQERAADADIPAAPFVPTVRDVLLETLFESQSNLLLLPVQDIFGWRDRINVPATVGDSNWTYRLPWPSDRLDREPEAQERKDKLREWSEKYNRF